MKFSAWNRNIGTPFFFFGLATFIVTIGLHLWIPNTAFAQTGENGAGLNLAFVITTDYETGGFATIDLDTKTVVDRQLGIIHSDAMVKWFNGQLFIINRFGQDNIQILDTNNGYVTTAQYSTGNGSNPHDIAFLSTEKAYVSLYEKPELLMVNPLTGERLGTIDLSAYADADGIPEVSALHLAGDTLYATVARLDRNNFWAPTMSSVVLRVDTVTDTVVGEIPIVMNPFSDFVEMPDGTLLIGSPGQFGVIDDGGINRIDPVTHTNTVAISEAQLGGDISGFVMVDESRGYAVVNDEAFNTSVILFDLDTQRRLETVLSAEGFLFSGLAVTSKKEVYVGWRHRENPGIRIIDGLTGREVTAQPIDVGLPPSNILILE
jgi:DNA-binding beta-propeller fold protein YncE